MITTIMLAAIALVATTQARLTQAEQSMVDALRTCNVPALKKLMSKQLCLYTVIPHNISHIKAKMPENYLVATSIIKPKTTDKDAKIALTRISNLVRKSKRIVKAKSIHNELTRNTIRGEVNSHDVWELHYEVRKDKTIVLRRVCEFDHASRFKW